MQPRAGLNIHMPRILDMEQSHVRIRRTRDEVTEEAKHLTNELTQKIYKDYKETPHVSLSMAEAFQNISDMATIEELLQNIIQRRNNSYIHP